MGLDACVRVQQSAIPDPRDVMECQRWRNILESIRMTYLIKLFPPPPGPDPLPRDFGRNFADPTPQPSYFSHLGIRDELFAEVVLENLRKAPSGVQTIFGDIQKSGAQIEIVKTLLNDLDKGISYLKCELHTLEKLS